MDEIHDETSRCTELDIDLERRSAPGSTPELFTVKFRIKRPGNEAEDGYVEHGRPLDRAALRASENDPAKYGAMLTELLFGTPESSKAFAYARGAADRLRIRLFLDLAAHDLHDLRWETLRDPDRPASSLLSSRRILFSRYLKSSDWAEVKLRPRKARALVVIADPADLGKYGLQGVDVAAQLARVRTSLADVEITTIVSDREASPPQRASLARIVEALGGEHDLLYLVCHGRHHKGESSLFLENDSGNTARTPDEALIQALRDLEQRPRLVVLASCEGAGAGVEGTSADGDALVALGPRLLTEAGIPAVLAMQGRVRIRTVETFMPVFFAELTRTGLIDRAVAVARGFIRDPNEASRPTLFMRLRSGRLWYNEGFVDHKKFVGMQPQALSAIRAFMKGAKCTPIIGPGLLETVFEFRGWLARSWAERYDFPLAPTQSEDLSAVAQFLAIEYGRDIIDSRIVVDLSERAERLLSTTSAGSPRSLAESLTALRARRFAGRADPYRILAEQPMPVYILGTQDPMLVEALRECGKRPQIGILPWRQGIKDKLPADFELTVQEPLVYHLFGTFDTPDSLVLTQDDYVEFLLRAQRPEVRDAIPPEVLRRLNTDSLLFLGFHIESWEFRVVFRTVEEHRTRVFRNYMSVVQLEPTESILRDPDGAYRYFQDYLGGTRIKSDIYWGTPEGLLAELAKGEAR